MSQTNPQEAVPFAFCKLLVIFKNDVRNFTDTYSFVTQSSDQFLMESDLKKRLLFN